MAVGRNPAKEPRHALRRLAAPPIRWIDQSLRAHYGIFEFSAHPRCVLRLSLTSAPSGVTLADGTRVIRGEQVGELHFWNERTMMLFSGGLTLRNGAEFRRRLHFSLRQVAGFVQADPRFRDVRAFLARTSVSDQLPRERLIVMVRRWGFETDPVPSTLPGRFADFWDNIHASLMSIAFAPEGRSWRAPGQLERVRLWLPRQRLLAFHSGGARRPRGIAAAEQP